MNQLNFNLLHSDSPVTRGLCLEVLGLYIALLALH